MATKAKIDWSEKANHEKAVSEALESLEQAVDKFNAVKSQAFAELAEKIDAANEAIGDAQGWMDEVAGEIQDFIDDHGEKWQEGEKGEAWSNLRDEWAVRLDEIEIEEPEEIECESEAAEIIDGLPEDEPE